MCSKCYEFDPRVFKRHGCPTHGYAGQGYNVPTCYGWYFTQPVAYELIDIERFAEHMFPNLMDAPNSVFEALREFRSIRNAQQWERIQEARKTDTKEGAIDAG